MARLDNNDLRYNTSLNSLERNIGTETWLTTPRAGTLSFTNVSADIGTVGAATAASTIFTPTVTGMYLLSFYGIPTAAGTGGDAAPNLYMKWTDTVGVNTYFNFAGNLDPVYSNGANQVSIPIYAVAGNPIFMATSAGVYGTLRWSFYFTVTAL